MKYWKKEYLTINAITAVCFTDDNYCQVAINERSTELTTASGDHLWCKNHYTSERGWTEIEKGEFLLIKSQAIEKL